MSCVGGARGNSGSQEGSVICKMFDDILRVRGTKRDYIQSGWEPI